ncbi:hypothetical protein [Flavobacterium sp.]|jgi:hypothetical protein|uniref:hypothetical protein n=1 Tax=Flavobacterium sp. TaxID=239 RepID=UPI0037835D43
MIGYLIKKKREYKNSVFLATIILLLFVFSTKKIDVDKITEKKLILTEKPTFKESGRKFTRYWVELKFETENKVCEINEADYKYLLYNEFEREINKGDTLEVKGIENKIYYLKKNGKEYLNFKKARAYESKSSGILIYLYIFVLIFSVCINFLKKKPRIKFLNKIYAINIDILFIILLILNLIILELTVGLNYFFNTKHM